MFLAIAALGVASLTNAQGPRPEVCVEGSVCDPSHTDDFADPENRKGAFALTNMAEVFPPDHYPEDALRDGKEGRVEVQVEIGPDGKAVRCTVKRSARVPSLDHATCNRLIEAGKFKIAHNRSGLPKSYKTSIGVVWVIPESEPFSDRRLKLVLPFDSAGNPGHCRTEVATEYGDEVPPCPESMANMARDVAAAAPNVDVIANRELVVEEGFLVGDPAQLAIIGQAPGETLLGINGFRIEVDAKGKVTACDAVEIVRNMTRAGVEKAACDEVKERRFDPLAKRDSNRQPRRAMLFFAAYLRSRAPSTD